MRVLFIAALCSGAILGQAAFAQTAAPSAPSDSAQPVAPSSTATAVPPPSGVAPSPASAAAAETAPAAVPQQSAGVNLDEIVCRNSPPPTGSRLGGGRECHTVREWNQRERESQDLTRQQEVTGFVTKGH